MRSTVIVIYLVLISVLTAQAQTNIDTAIIKAEKWLTDQSQTFNNPGVIYDLWLANQNKLINVQMPNPWEIKSLSREEKAMFQTLKAWKEKSQKPTYAQLELLGSQNELLRNEIFSMFCSDVAIPANLMEELNEQSSHGGYYACYTLRELHRIKSAQCINKNDSITMQIENKVLQGLSLLLQFPDLVGCTPSLNLNFTCFTLIETGNTTYLNENHVLQILTNQLADGSWSVDENQNSDLFSTAYALLFLSEIRKNKDILH